MSLTAIVGGAAGVKQGNKFEKAVSFPNQS